jgi:hypothetical protein
MDAWDPLDQRGRRDRLLLSLAVAVATGGLVMHALRWRRLSFFELWLLIFAVGLAAMIGFVASSQILARRSARRWSPIQVPRATARGYGLTKRSTNRSL